MMWKKIYDCMVRIKICMYILKNKGTILSVGVLKWFLFVCAGHGMSSVGVKPTTGSYRQV